MFVKGTAVIARRDAVVSAFGEKRWNEFVATQDPAFRKVIATDRIDVHKYLQLQEAMLKEFYRNDPKALVTFGEKSAEWALREGPYQSFAAGKNIATFATAVMPAVWRTYYSEGSLVAETRDQTVHVHIHDLPVMHQHLELGAMAWFRRALEIVTGKLVRAQPIIRAAPGAREIYYQFTIMG